MSEVGTLSCAWADGHFPTLRITGAGEQIPPTLHEAFARFTQLTHCVIDLLEMTSAGDELFELIQKASFRTQLTVAAKVQGVVDQCLQSALVPFPTIRSAELALMGEQTVTQLLTGLRDIPSRKPQAASLAEYVSKGGATYEGVEQRIRQMPLLVCQVLRIANSPPFAPPKPQAETLLQALNNLGMEHLSRLVMMNHYQVAPTLHPLQQNVLQEALSCAVLADACAEQLRFSAEERSQVWLAGLLHNLGLLGMAFFFPDRYLMVQEYVARQVKPIQAELLVFGIDHQVIGRLMASRWRFPDALVAFIGKHHVEGFALENPILLPVVFADTYLASRRGVVEPPWEPMLKSLFKFYGRFVPWKNPGADFERLLAEAVKG